MMRYFVRIFIENMMVKRRTKGSVYNSPRDLFIMNNVNATAPNNVFLQEKQYW